MVFKIVSEQFQKTLLNWYDNHKRQLPWRSLQADPYKIWISEIMLQQTTVATVIPYFEIFIKRFPTVEVLARASLEEVLCVWQGLGYYKRAHNLYQTAKEIVEKYSNHWPRDELTWRSFSGIGEYTAAAIVSIAFQERAVVVDGNISRILSRIFSLEKPIKKNKHGIKKIASHLTPHLKPGDYAQALMDLGALICKPINPACHDCPIQLFCKAFSEEKTLVIPAKLPVLEKPSLFGLAFILEREDSAILLNRQNVSSLLKGLIEVPTTPWLKEEFFQEKDYLNYIPWQEIAWERIPGTVKHSFTHFTLYLTCLKGRGEIKSFGFWVQPSDFYKFPLSTLMKKVLCHALPQKHPLFINKSSIVV